MATLGKLIKRLCIAVTTLFSLLIVWIMALMLFGVTVDLNFMKGGVEASAKSVLGREVTINGPAFLEFSDWPAIEVQDVRIANVAGASEPQFLQAGLARLQIGIFPLLKGKIEIAEIKTEQVILNLENNEQGEPNWVFTTETETAPPPEAEQKTPEQVEEDQSSIQFIGLNELTLKDIAVTYHDASLDKTITFRIDNLYGEAEPDKPMLMVFEGLLQEKNYDLKFSGGSIEELLSWDKPWPFKLEGDLLGKRIRSEGNLALRNQKPEANFEFAVKDIDIGAILARFGLIEGLEASTGSMGIKLSLRGNSLHKIVKQSSMAFSVENGMWRIESPTSDTYLDVTELNGGIFVERGSAITIKLAGMVGEIPVNFIITGAPLAEYIAAPKALPLSIVAQFANNTLSFGGELALPISSKDVSMSLGFETTSLENLNQVLKLDLLPVGPIHFKSHFQLQEKVYDMPRLDLQVGDSKLAGTMNLDLTKDTPKATIELISELISLDDLEAIWDIPEGEQDTETPAEGEDPGEKTEKTETEQKESEKVERKLLSPAVLASVEADLLIKTKQVVSGEDDLGSGTLQVSLHEGRLAVEPLRLNIPGGGVQVDFDYLPTEKDVTLNLKANIDKFDLGILARRKKPDTDMGGAFTLDADIHSTAPDPKSVMEYANGHFDFLLVPKNFSSGLIDLWAVNLLSAIMTKVAEEEKSVINCVVVRFGLENGFMEEKAIYMDTSNMRVSGRGEIDFEFKELYFMLSPKAKRPEFFSLAVPIKVEGNFEDFGLGIGIIRMTGSLVSFITSPIHVPFRRIFGNEIPEDGQEACRQAWTLTREE